MDWLVPVPFFHCLLLVVVPAYCTLVIVPAETLIKVMSSIYAIHSSFFCSLLQNVTNAQNTLKSSRPELENGMELERLENNANWKGKKVDVAINCNCCWFIDLFMQSIASDRHDMVWLTRMSIRWWANGSHQERVSDVVLWVVGRSAKKETETQFAIIPMFIAVHAISSMHIWSDMQKPKIKSCMEKWRSNVAHSVCGCSVSTKHGGDEWHRIFFLLFVKLRSATT